MSSIALATPQNPVQEAITASTRLGPYPVHTIISYLGLTREEVQRFLLEAPTRLFGNIGFMNTPSFPWFPAIGECNCSTFDRTAVGPRGQFRSALEELTIHRIRQLHTNKTAPLKISSLASGGCFQELVYIAKLLLREGYTNIQLDLIDPCYLGHNGYGSPDSVEQLRRCLQEYVTPTNATVTISAHTDHEIYMRQMSAGTITKPNVFLMIDLNDASCGLADGVINTLIGYPDPMLITFTQGTGGFCYNRTELKTVHRLNRIERRTFASVSRERGPSSIVTQVDYVLTQGFTPEQALKKFSPQT